MFVYNHSDLDLEDPFLSSYPDSSFSELYEGEEEDCSFEWVSSRWER